MIERFWRNVDRRGPDECWGWQGGKTKGGYGKMSVRGREQYAHRLAWKLAHGAIPEGMCVCHRCDNRRCVNPAHLFVGTHAENMADRDAKGRTARGDQSGPRLYRERMPRGEQHCHAKLKEWQIAYILELAASGLTHKDIANAYGVNPAAIGHVISGRTWKSARRGPHSLLFNHSTPSQNAAIRAMLLA